jgi:hypothetical protein
MDVIGYFFGALLRTAIIVILFFIIIKIFFKRPLSREAARVLGIGMFIIFTLLPIIFSGEVIINIIMGFATGYACTKIAYWASQPATGR